MTKRWDKTQVPTGICTLQSILIVGGNLGQRPQKLSPMYRYRTVGTVLWVPYENHVAVLQRRVLQKRRKQVLVPYGTNNIRALPVVPYLPNWITILFHDPDVLFILIWIFNNSTGGRGTGTVGYQQGTYLPTPYPVTVGRYLGTYLPYRTVPYLNLL